VSETEHRQLTIKVFRYDPRTPDVAPRMQAFQVEEAEGMTLFIALNEIRETMDPGLNFDFVCRAGVCGSCGMLINGRPGLACRTLTKNLDREITLAPLPGFELIADLSVNTGKWMRAMSERLETWIHPSEEETDLAQLEERWSPTWPRRSTSLTGASNAAAAWRRAERRKCAETLSARSASTR
jgi:fumarate reductase iron-sulfur subunit